MKSACILFPEKMLRELRKISKRTGNSVNSLVRDGAQLKLDMINRPPPEGLPVAARCTYENPCCNKKNVWFGRWADADRPVCPRQCTCHH